MLSWVSAAACVTTPLTVRAESRSSCIQFPGRFAADFQPCSASSMPMANPEHCQHGLVRVLSARHVRLDVAGHRREG
eukprot:249645-Rhodomonas_salina.2